MDKWLRNTNVVRVIALVIGILLWVVVHMDQKTGTGTTTSISNREETINNVTITKKYDESLYYVSSVSPSNVQVIVRGKDSEVKKLTTSNNYRVELDLTKVGKGEHDLALTPVGFPTTLEVVIVPRTVHVVIEEQQKKEVPVVINVKGTPAAGLKAGQPIVKPNKVYITAPTSRLSEIETVRGEVSVDKADAAVTKQVKLLAYDKNGKEIAVSMNPQVVDVEVPITSPFQTIPLQLKITGDPLKGFAIASIVQTPDKVTVYGKQDVVDKMEFYQGPALNLQNVSASKEYILDIPLLANKITQVDPAKVSIQVEIVPSVTKALENIPITIIGQNDGFNTKVITPDTGKLNITVEGAPKIIDVIKASDVQAIVDVSNLPPGQHPVLVSFNLPSFVKKGALQDILATVEISSKTPASAGPSASPSPSPTKAP
ncbi:CdaR family protein [Paenibacillus sp. GP183]|jgi:YbbR domain-containing protein|uniref:CdaR family protein n=1 Tax=Paenibacillus sp. GP183 TaxID=1882751 RepID=UPI00089CC6E0|nr:CdaR family protein [Paenibacillus sp. GP183]SEC17017.1 YbbR domain-containing protein [Paenibacillus sp. GP183]